MSDVKPNVVNKNLKVDFHIHSYASHHKDGALVSNCKVENIDILITKLKENKVDIFAITDHDCFDKTLYLKLKEHEGRDFEKVFPGVEFSLYKQGDNSFKEIHVIAIFDDTDPKNIEAISKYLPITNIQYDVDGQRCFSESKFKEILNKIGVGAVLIAHQKNSETSKTPQPRDANSLGEDTFNELINIEYFDAFEYKTPKQHIFHTLFQKSTNSETYDKIKYLTGSDCHQWEHYPKHDYLSHENMYSTYLKCLPSFRGLVMCVTDASRMSGHSELFDDGRKYLDKIEIVIGGQERTIQLSRGLNVIIGDNSIGKSLLLHKITEYSKIREGVSGIPKNLELFYEKFLADNSMQIRTIINKNDYMFDVQGGIRYSFEGGNFFASFSSDKYPEKTDSLPYKTFVKNKMDECYSLLDNKFNYDFILNNLPDIFVVEKPNHSNICSAKTCPGSAFERRPNLSKIISKLENIKITNQELIDKCNLEIDEIDELEKYQKYIISLLEKYISIKNEEERKTNIITALNTAITEYNEDVQKMMSKEETKYNELEENEQTIIDGISVLPKLKSGIGNFDCTVTNPMRITYSHNDFGRISFVSSFANKINEIDTQYIKSLISRVVRKDSVDLFDTKTITESFLTSIIVDASIENGQKGLELFKTKVNNLIDLDFKNVNAITENGKFTETYSAGFNSKEYFYLIGNDLNRKEIYLIDQPEDDVSQISIADDIVPIFRSIRNRRQVILITHNPQFVVNADADNVIYFFKNENGLIDVVNGALEFSDGNIDILSIVEKALDGGEESIKKRWKRYEKSS